MKPHYQAGLVLTDLFLRCTAKIPTVAGTENLPAPGTRSLYICNHDDIIREAGITNLELHRLGRPLSTIIVGENLNNLANQILLRLAPIRLVPRGENKGERTAAIIKEELERGHDVWVAQNDGRTKTGSHNTHPNILYKLAGQYQTSIDTLVKNVAVVPVAVSAELDPASPLLIRAELDKKAVKRGETPKRASTFHDIRVGFFGYKGRTHIAFGKRLEGSFQNRADAARSIDRFIMANYECYSTHKAAYEERSRHPFEEWTIAPVNLDGINNRLLRRQIKNTDEDCRSAVVARYAMAEYERRVMSGELPERCAEQP